MEFKVKSRALDAPKSEAAMMAPVTRNLPIPFSDAARPAIDSGSLQKLPHAA
jgi:hypothetical protein